MLAKARDRLASETDYGVSLGGAWHACAREDLDELVRAADESMYADKQEHYGDGYPVRQFSGYFT